MSAALEANLEEVTETVSGRVRRPITLMLLLVVGAVVIFAAGEPISAAVESGLKRRMRPAPGHRGGGAAGAGAKKSSGWEGSATVPQSITPAVASPFAGSAAGCGMSQMSNVAGCGCGSGTGSGTGSGSAAGFG